MYDQVPFSDLRIPDCPLPRPGDRVCWYADSRFVTGILKGHNARGEPLITNEFGNPVVKESFETIRLLDPFNRRGPNWSDLQPAGCIFRPPPPILEAFTKLLNERIPPGPTYLDLAREIWSRGFEVYVVGGTVRDILTDRPSHDVDLVTTMPLSYSRRVIRSMYRYDPSKKYTRGFIRIGGTPESGDPFIDLKVFSDSLPGTEEATFGVGFDRDVAHRDFACNSIYYDPINQVLIDPTCRGIPDTLGSTLTLVCATSDPYQHAQVFIRLFKFCLRGFVPTPETLDRICAQYSTAVPSMKTEVRIRYVRAQVLNKCADIAEHRSLLESMGSLMRRYGVGQVWSSYFAPHVEDLCRENR